jgi:putative phage-type endonuclease
MTFHSYANREAWLVARRSLLGASDIAAALGFNPWKSPVAVWAEKTGNLPAEDLAAIHERIRWGQRFELPIIEEFAERNPDRLVQAADPFTIHQHPDVGFLGCTPDAWQNRISDGGPRGVLQAKTTNEMMGKHWKEEASIPLQYQIQVQAELACTGCTWGTLAALIGGQRLVWYDVQRDDEFIEAMLESAAKFWWYVQNNKMPPADDSELTSRVLTQLHPRDNGLLVEVTSIPADMASKADEARAQIKELEKDIELFENTVKAALGDNTYARLPDGSLYAWKTSDRAGFTVAPKSIRTLRKVGESATKKILKALE